MSFFNATNGWRYYYTFIFIRLELMLGDLFTIKGWLWFVNLIAVTSVTGGVIVAVHLFAILPVA